MHLKRIKNLTAPPKGRAEHKQVEMDWAGRFFARCVTSASASLSLGSRNCAPLKKVRSFAVLLCDSKSPLLSLLLHAPVRIVLHATQTTQLPAQQRRRARVDGGYSFVIFGPEDAFGKSLGQQEATRVPTRPMVATCWVRYCAMEAGSVAMAETSRAAGRPVPVPGLRLGLWFVPPPLPGGAVPAPAPAFPPPPSSSESSPSLPSVPSSESSSGLSSSESELLLMIVACPPARRDKPCMPRLEMLSCGTTVPALDMTDRGRGYAAGGGTGAGRRGSAGCRRGAGGRAGDGGTPRAGTSADWRTGPGARGVHPQTRHRRGGTTMSRWHPGQRSGISAPYIAMKRHVSHSSSSSSAGGVGSALRLGAAGLSTGENLDDATSARLTLQTHGGIRGDVTAASSTAINSGNTYLNEYFNRSKFYPDDESLSLSNQQHHQEHLGKLSDKIAKIDNPSMLRQPKQSARKHSRMPPKIDALLSMAISLRGSIKWSMEVKVKFESQK
ncbi:hypothetical protein QBC33DRAFT_519987 [Phialemonium atrogriseum]|uniref:Uncharacterized protein n=1 Tax=Phialemonium atrogriseum TaxID=1093897 RepID=A0AAJ0BPY0_9PEZI|nr:uncharacterized protein QBC33DRAFT_519987 [Phialemonium atrogriseum]KAK1761927.1 hypothetical protein QBC33DRAFT_519987 [Phialemonium atrogriseum]